MIVTVCTLASLIINDDPRATRSTSVTFCGSPTVAKVLLHSVLFSNHLSQVLSYPQFHTEFRTVWWWWW